MISALIAGVADTHAALWYIFGDPRLSPSARAFLDQATQARQKVAVSAISIVELVYLIEKERLPPSAYEALMSALADPEHILIEADFTAAIAASMRFISRQDVPDMPDRMIAATAVHLGIPILSRDRRIHSANLNTIW